MLYKNYTLSLLLFFCLSLYSYSIGQGIMWALGSRGGQEITEGVRSDDSTPLPSELKYPKLHVSLQKHLENKYYYLVFRKEQGSVLRAQRNVIYIGHVWEEALLNDETKENAMKLLEAAIEYFSRKNASGFYDIKLMNVVSADVVVGLGCWKSMPYYQNCFKGRVKIAVVTSAGGYAVNRLIHYMYDDLYNFFIEEEPKTEWEQ